MDMSSLFSLKGRRALVTGGSSGIGLAMAQAIGTAGGSITLVGRREPELEKGAGELRSNGIDADWISADLSGAVEARSCAMSFLKRHGRADILVNAAGIHARRPFSDITPEDWKQHLDVHLTAPFFLTQVLAPVMSTGRWGRIINVASLQSYRAFENGAPYGTCKGGIAQMTRAIAQEWSSKGVTCNAIGPGFFKTALTAPVFENSALREKLAAQTCIGRNGELDDLYGATIFLASNASAYITGQILMVDGGFTAK